MRLLISIVSVWEIVLLAARGRIGLPLPIRSWVDLALAPPGIRLLGLTHTATIVDSVNLPGDAPRDPADRFLIATAREHGAVLVTRDEGILRYGKASHVRVFEA
jgi:PIN domain nuclease of toxin-antitoxin system